jgi:hypothetical protein
VQPPCSLRFAIVANVLRFAKLGSDSVPLRPGGVQNPPSDSGRNDLLATALVAFEPRFAFGSRGSRPSFSDSKKAPEWELFEVAEREGFEPSVESPLRSLSKGVLSTTQPSFR